MNLHAKLKEKTKNHHAKIESVPLLDKIIKGSITLSEYQTLIKKFYGYIAPCENLIKQLPCRDLLEGREKTVFLKKDLLFFGLDEDFVKVVDHSHYLPLLTNYEQAVGYMYVMEGATLGGQIITELLKNKLNLTPENGLSYFYGYGENTKVKWGEFCQILNDKIKQEQADEIIKSAAHTYSTLHKWTIY